MKEFWRRNWKVILLVTYCLVAFGVVSEMDYQDQVLALEMKGK